jgi:hypothetical protein
MREIILTKGQIALVDDEDYWRLMQYKWYTLQGGGGHLYAFNVEKGLMHQFIINSEYMVDHKDRNGLNNQKSNLRECTPSKNQANRIKETLRKTTSKYKGVYWYSSKGRWRAIITKDSKRYHLGYFKSENEAAIAYNSKALELFGEFALLNIIE